MESPLVSVIIPTYNREKILLRAIESIKKQTYTNWEIIIIDDNSTDNTEEIIKNEINKNIRYYKNNENLGGAASRNIGAQYAKGDFFAFLDSDDEWYEFKLKIQVDILKSNKNIDMVFTDYMIINENTGSKIIFNNNKDITTKNLLSNNFIGTTSSICIKREKFLEIGGFNSNLLGCQDWDLYIRAYQNNFARVDKPCLNYYFHNESITGNYKNIVDAHKKVFLSIDSILNDESCILDTKTKKYIKSSNSERLGHVYMKFREMKKGRSLFWKAINYNRSNANAWKHLIASIVLGKNYYAYKIIK